MMCYTTFNRLFHEYPVSGGKKGSVQLEALHPKPESLPCRAQGQQSFLRGYLEAAAARLGVQNLSLIAVHMKNMFRQV